MLKQIKIGAVEGLLSRWKADFLQQQMEHKELPTVVILLASDGGASEEDILTSALLEGRVDICAHTLSDLPTQQNTDLAIAAVSERLAHSQCLLIRKEAVDRRADLALKENAEVAVSSHLNKRQLLYFRADVRCSLLSGEDAPLQMLRRWQHGEWDALLLSQLDVQHIGLDESDFELLRLHPREFIPSPGHGVLAYRLRKNDIELRKTLQAIHHPEISAVTNIERKVLKLLGNDYADSLGAYCEQDTMDNYHLWVAIVYDNKGEIKRIQYSSSTSHGLAERVASEIMIA